MDRLAFCAGRLESPRKERIDLDRRKEMPMGRIVRAKGKLRGILGFWSMG